MKAEISVTGELVLIPESQTERYAINHWKSQTNIEKPLYIVAGDWMEEHDKNGNVIRDGLLVHTLLPTEHNKFITTQVVAVNKPGLSVVKSFPKSTLHLEGDDPGLPTNGLSE